MMFFKALFVSVAASAATTTAKPAASLCGESCKPENCLKKGEDSNKATTTKPEASDSSAATTSKPEASDSSTTSTTTTAAASQRRLDATKGENNDDKEKL